MDLCLSQGHCIKWIETISVGIWNQFANSLSYANNCYIIHTSMDRLTHKKWIHILIANVQFFGMFLKNFKEYWTHLIELLFTRKKKFFFALKFIFILKFIFRNILCMMKNTSKHKTYGNHWSNTNHVQEQIGQTWVFYFVWLNLALNPGLPAQWASVCVFIYIYNGLSCQSRCMTTQQFS